MITRDRFEPVVSSKRRLNCKKHTRRSHVNNPSSSSSSVISRALCTRVQSCNGHRAVTVTPLSIVPLQTTFRAAQCLWIEPAISPMQPVCRRCRCDIWALLRGTDPAAAQSQGRRDVVRAHRLSAAEVCSTCGHNTQSAFLFSKKEGLKACLCSTIKCPKARGPHLPVVASAPHLPVLRPVKRIPNPAVSPEARTP